MARPRLIFFCELEPGPLQELFDDPTVLEALSALDAGVSLGILDLTSARAAVVRRLNQAAIPVVAWLLLPRDQGYWFHAGNAPLATARYEAFRAWTAEHGLQWAGVGLDIELDIQEAQWLLTDRRRLLPVIARRLFDLGRLHRAQREYCALVGRIRADGYRVDSYILPFILDERRVGSTLLQRVGGLVDVPADREVPMLYTSFLRPRGPGFLWSYGPEVQAIGVGSTGGGVTLEGMPRISPLSWEELARDLRLARRWTETIYVFSLEGCAQQGFLDRLRTFDWERPVEPPLRMARQVTRWRRALRAGLWLSAHPWAAFAGVVGAWWLSARLCRGVCDGSQAGARAGGSR